MKATNNHTATYRGRRVRVVLTSGETVIGTFVERRKNHRIVLIVNGEKRTYDRDTIARFMSGNGTRGPRQ